MQFAELQKFRIEHGSWLSADQWLLHQQPKSRFRVSHVLVHEHPEGASQLICEQGARALVLHPPSAQASPLRS